MLSSKSKSGLSETAHNKTTTATPKISRLTKGVSAKSEPNSPSSLQNRRLSIDRSPRSVDSKPAVDRRVPKVSTPPDKQRALKGANLQSQLDQIQEDLKKAKERLASIEKEKEQILEELKEAKRLDEEANEKLREALVAQKRAEESSEIEKFRAVELEQAGIDASQKREKEWKKELEVVRDQHAIDVASLLSTTQELQIAKQELTMTFDAKTTALAHADDVMKVAEINAEKADFLSGEVGRLKALLDSKLEFEAKETAELGKKLESEVDSLKQELERAKMAEEKLFEMEGLIEGLTIEVKDAKSAESDLGDLVNEWKNKAELLEIRIEELNQSERYASESLVSAVKQLEVKSVLLQDAESAIASLRENVESLEISLGRHRGDLEESDWKLVTAKGDVMEMAKTIDFLKSELETAVEEKEQALRNEKLADSSVQTLLEAKNKLIEELEVSRDEEEKSKKAMESLAMALHEVSMEAREAKENLLTSQGKLGNAETQIEDLKLVLKNAEEKYEAMLDEAEDEILHLKNGIERSEFEVKNSKAELDKRKLNFENATKKSEEETAAIKTEMERLINLIKKGEEEEQAAKEDEVALMNTLKQAESDASSAKEVAEEARTEGLRLKEMLLDKENKLQSINQENEDLRIREAIAVKKVEELSKSLAEAITKKAEENGELSSSENEYDLLPNKVELAEERELNKKTNSELSSGLLEEHDGEDLLGDVSPMEEESEEENGNKNAKAEDSVEVEVKMWETCKIVAKDLEPEPESFEEELALKADRDSFDKVNGLPLENMDSSESSPTKQQQKKKKALLSKFGSLLKKKGNSK